MSKVLIGNVRGPKGDPGDPGPAGPAGPNTVPTAQAILDALTAQGNTRSSAGFLRMAGTVPGSVPVVKPSGDGRAGVWEMTHNDSTGYMFHLLAGASMGHNAAIIAIGVDNDGIGLLIPNKKDGRAIVIDQKSTSAEAYGIHATQSSTVAPMVRLEMNNNAAADVLQLLAFGAPGASQRLAYVGDPTGMAGQILAASGVLDWRRNVQIRNVPTGEVANYLGIFTSTSANSANTRRSYHGAADDFFFGATGSAGVYYPYRMAHAGSTFAIQTASNLTAAAPTAPDPSEVSTWTTQLSISNANGVSLRGGVVKADATGLAFFTGATAAKYVGLPVDATDLASAIALVNAIKNNVIIRHSLAA